MFWPDRRTALKAIGGTAAALILTPEAHPQDAGYDRAQPMESRAEFDVENGKFIVLEFAPASERLRAIGSQIGIRFQIAEARMGVRWVPLIGFTLGSEDGLRALQVDFADLPVYENLAMEAELLDYPVKKRQSLARVLVPTFKRRDVHAIRIAAESDSVVSVTIDGKRRPLDIDFKPHRLLVRASGVQGWVEFAEPGIA